MRTSHRQSKSTKGWRRRAPHLTSERRALKKRCGAKAFLDPKRLKFPIVAKMGGCAIDCAGLEAAVRRAGQFHHRKVEAKAKRLGKHAACRWAK